MYHSYQRFDTHSRKKVQIQTPYENVRLRSSPKHFEFLQLTRGRTMSSEPVPAFIAPSLAFTRLPPAGPLTRSVSSEFIAHCTVGSTQITPQGWGNSGCMAPGGCMSLSDSAATERLGWGPGALAASSSGKHSRQSPAPFHVHSRVAGGSSHAD